MPQEISAEDFMNGQDVGKPAPAPSAPQLSAGFDKLPPKMKKKLLDKWGYEVDENGEPLSTASEGWGGLVHKIAHDTDPVNVASKFGRDFGKAIDKQGGWGLTPELRRQMGADNPDEMPMLRPLKNLPANIADGAYRGLQTVMGGIDAIPRMILPDSIVDDPVLGAMAVGEGGGGIHPKLDIKPIQEALSKGSVAEIIQAYEAAKSPVDHAAIVDYVRARDAGAPVSTTPKIIINPEELPAGVSIKDAANAVDQTKGLQEDAANFKGTPDPKPTDVFPTDESRAADAKALEDKLSIDAEQFMAGRDAPEPVPVEPTPEPAPEAVPETGISKKEANTQFKEATEEKKPLTTKEFEQKLQADAAKFVEDKASPEPTPAPTPDTEVTPVPKADIVTRLTEALNKAAKLTPTQKALTSAARSQRLAAAIAARKGTSGEAGLRAELSQLKGEMPKVESESVRPQFSQGDIDELFDSIRDKPDLTAFEQINARTALAKLLDGGIPTPSETHLLGKIFPADFVKAATKHRALSSKVLDAAGNFLNIPRSLMSSVDLSAPFRQGLFLVGRKEFWNSWGSMFKAFGDERAAKAVSDNIRSRGTYKLMETSGLSITDNAASLTHREEQFMSQWAEKIPVVGGLVKRSERAYTTFLNKVRADTFDSLVKLSKEAGIDFKENPKALNDIASFVNNATGRGSLGKLSQAGPVLNGLFFSPRLIASRLTLLNPAYYVKLSPVVRKEAIKSLLTLGALATTVTTLAKAGGADVEADPRSSDFAKIKTGNTRYDILGGFGQYIVLGARLATNEKKTAKGEIQTLGKKFGSPTRLDVLTQFGINKESPVASFVTDYLRGKNAVGEKFEAKTAVAQRFVPLIMQDIADVMKDQHDPVKAAAMSVPSIFGVGMQTYDENTPNKKDFVKAAPAEPSGQPVSDEISPEEFMKGSPAP